jgi:hypothetical protein
MNEDSRRSAKELFDYIQSLDPDEARAVSKRFRHELRKKRRSWLCSRRNLLRKGVASSPEEVSKYHEHVFERNYNEARDRWKERVSVAERIMLFLGAVGAIVAAVFSCLQFLN